GGAEGEPSVGAAARKGGPGTGHNRDDGGDSHVRADAARQDGRGGRRGEEPGRPDQQGLRRGGGRDRGALPRRRQRGRGRGDGPRGQGGRLGGDRGPGRPHPGGRGAPAVRRGGGRLRRGG